MSPLFLADFYKVSHIFQYPENLEYVYSNITPRKSRIQGVDKMVVFGITYALMEYIAGAFNHHFFEENINNIIDEYSRRMQTALGTDLKSYDHIEALHAKRFLPLHIKALPEGSLCPMRVPFLTIRNTDPDFGWLTSYPETLLSCLLWQPCTSATHAYYMRNLINWWGHRTGVPQDFLKWQGHDFSFRGMSSPESAVLSGAGHLLSFVGTDTMPAIDFMEQYYGADAEKELIGGSVPATEHSVMCAGGCDNEIDTIRRLITEVHPTGIVSIVSDTWNLWTVLTKYLPALKKEIMARDGKVVIRPDSGDPPLIIAGNPNGKTEEERKGVVELLWDVFGGEHTSASRMLDPHVGVIYGDSINLDRADKIASMLHAKNFASQVVLGVGSYTYQYNTRDTFGIAMKATHVVIDGQPRDIYKTPITDDGTKNSATGLLRVDEVDGTFVLKERCTPEEEAGGALKTVFKNGVITKFPTLSEIRSRLWGENF